MTDGPYSYFLDKNRAKARAFVPIVAGFMSTIVSSMAGSRLTATWLNLGFGHLLHDYTLAQGGPEA